MNRNWNKRCRRWRKQWIRHLTWKYRTFSPDVCLRTCLMAVLCLELTAGTGIVWMQKQPELKLVHTKRLCEVELVTENSAGSGVEDGAEVYGLRLDLQALEVQFYHRKDSVRRH